MALHQPHLCPSFRQTLGLGGSSLDGPELSSQKFKHASTHGCLKDVQVKGTEQHSMSCLKKRSKCWLHIRPGNPDVITLEMTTDYWRLGWPRENARHPLVDGSEVMELPHHMPNCVTLGLGLIKHNSHIWSIKCSLEKSCAVVEDTVLHMTCRMNCASSIPALRSARRQCYSECCCKCVNHHTAIPPNHTIHLFLFFLKRSLEEKKWSKPSQLILPKRPPDSTRPDAGRHTRRLGARWTRRNQS